MFKFAIVILILMIALVSLGVVVGFKRIRFGEDASRQQPQLRMFFTSLTDIWIMTVFLVGIITKAFAPEEALIGLSIFLILLHVGLAIKWKRGDK